MPLRFVKPASQEITGLSRRSPAAGRRGFCRCRVQCLDGLPMFISCSARRRAGREWPVAEPWPRRVCGWKILSAGPHVVRDSTWPANKSGAAGQGASPLCARPGCPTCPCGEPLQHSSVVRAGLKCRICAATGYGAFSLRSRRPFCLQTFCPQRMPNEFCRGNGPAQKSRECGATAGQSG
jgi:hypothetical protein